MPHNLNISIVKRYVVDHTFVASFEENIRAIRVVCDLF